ncbi:hypothetical protein KZX46_21060 (plasmid) [Polymorphobacter sp. PAMC 29334]|uniref:hypothetical protein n=1 Tax=Polymorphobacter sp. PAMC 29334 TaxID=2862331 RepID=UPI001C746C4A|nr:hypothetical protein [Polymorphobacter sp. PAMC 29334]QYE37047.1 hypothetical protein KZX46_21060 [Polymorphobacter sp. PAMC 29334]
MGKQTWAKFTTAHPTVPAFTAAVSSSLPKSAPILDKAGQKLPTPYGLLVEWLKDNLSGDWSSMTKSKLVIVKVADQADGAVITTRFPAIGAAKKTPASASTIQINYADSDYVNVARGMGYKL